MTETVHCNVRCRSRIQEEMVKLGRAMVHMRSFKGSVLITYLAPLLPFPNIPRDICCVQKLWIGIQCGGSRSDSGGSNYFCPQLLYEQTTDDSEYTCYICFHFFFWITEGWRRTRGWPGRLPLHLTMWQNKTYTSKPWQPNWAICGNKWHIIAGCDSRRL